MKVAVCACQRSVTLQVNLSQRGLDNSVLLWYNVYRGGRVLKFKNFHLKCDGCDNCIIRFKCYTNRGIVPMTWKELKLVIEENSLVRRGK